MTPFLARELVATGVVAAGFLAVMVAAEIWKRVADPPAEWTRKFVHFFGGLIAATFPWVFHSRWAVVVLAGAFGAIIWGTRRLGLLGSVHAVERESEGGLWYPLAVLVVYLIGRDQPIFYLISILALVVADALAALLGSTYGRQMYEVESDRRSIEGSAVFFLTTFLIAHLPLLLFAGIEPLASVLLSTQLALIVTQFEAISLRGNDNLVVPLATYYLLIKLTPYGADHIGAQLIAQVVIIAVIALVAWRARSLRFSGAIALMLFAYGAYALGGAEWIVAPGLALLGFVAVRTLYGQELPTPDARYQVVATFYVCIVPAALFIANNTMETLVPAAPDAFRWLDPLYVPYVGVVAAQLALIFIGVLEPFRPDVPARTRRVLGSAAAALLLVAPAGLIPGVHGLTPQTFLLAATTVVVAVVAYLVIRRLPAWPHAPPWNVRLQALSTALAVVVVVPLELWRIGVLGE